MSAQLVDLLGALARVPALPGARCRGRAGLFDGDDGPDGELTRQAAALCRMCPALTACAAWADRQPENRLDGVVAGRLYQYAAHASVRKIPNGLAVQPITGGLPPQHRPHPQEHTAENQPTTDADEGPTMPIPADINIAPADQRQTALGRQ